MGTNDEARWLPGLPQPVKKTENKSEEATLPSIIPVKRIASHAALSCDRRKGKSLTGIQKGELHHSLQLSVRGY